MRVNLRHFSWMLALAIGGSTMGTYAVAQPTYQDRDRDQNQSRDRDQGRDRDQNQNHDRNRNSSYMDNQAYQQGMREGSEDHDSRRHKRKKPHFDNKDDRKAYDKGYKEGYKGHDQR